LPVSDVAEPYVSVTDIKHYIYCPRLVYFDRVLHAQPVFGSQQEESQELHEEPPIRVAHAKILGRRGLKPFYRFS